PLANPPRDARLMTSVLKKVGFAVVELIDADRPAMRDAIIAFGRRLKSDDAVGLFYFAGHGVQVDGRNYLLPVGADIQNQTEVLLQGLNLAELLSTMHGAGSRVSIAVLDACRNNPFDGSVRGISRGLAQVLAPAGTLIAYSTAPGKVALDGTGQNSPYTAALAEAMPRSGLAIEDVFKRARQQVMRATKGAQVPWEHSSLIGNLVLVPQTGAPQISGRDEPADGAPRLAELQHWDLIKTSVDPEDFRKHLARFPQGDFNELAGYKIGVLEKRLQKWTWWVSGGDAAHDGHQKAESLYERALKLESGTSDNAKLAEARGLYLKAADEGLAAAMYQLGRHFDHGRGVPRDHVKAAQWYRKAADKGHARALAAVGTMYEFGEGVGRDLAEALRYYRLAAEKGDADGMTSLGYLYATGKGVYRAPRQAQQWYEKAARSGHSRAMFNLALLLLSPEDRLLDYGQAKVWLEKAAVKGHAGAMRQLAALYDSGQGVNRDAAKAADYLLKSYIAGNDEASKDLTVRVRRWSRATRKAIQDALVKRGLYSGRVNGVFNIATRKAIAALRSRG
ncbi:MAG TPA: caspase family protein, partial [Hyphomicrobiaceae bacterium]|nr:caspase family protein [Hyphomicrobiaceae bacterium]